MVYSEASNNCFPIMCFIWYYCESDNINQWCNEPMFNALWQFLFFYLNEIFLDESIFQPTDFDIYLLYFISSSLLFIFQKVLLWICIRVSRYIVLSYYSQSELYVTHVHSSLLISFLWAVLLRWNTNTVLHYFREIHRYCVIRGRYFQSVWNLFQKVLDRLLGEVTYRNKSQVSP